MLLCRYSSTHIPNILSSVPGKYPFAFSRRQSPPNTRVLAIMYFTTALFGFAVTASTALAAPSLNPRAETVSAVASVPEWTITDFQRTCNDADTSCFVSFGIDTHLEPVTNCAYNIIGSPASRASVENSKCGPYTFGSNWSGFFGPDKGFTTWSFADWNNLLIIYPSYSDSELVNGFTVTPNKNYLPEIIR